MEAQNRHRTAEKHKGEKDTRIHFSLSFLLLSALHFQFDVFIRLHHELSLHVHVLVHIHAYVGSLNVYIIIIYYNYKEIEDVIQNCENIIQE